MTIAVDFDGTICDHTYPTIGNDVPGAFHWLSIFQKHGVKLILWTMRDGKELQDAVDHCAMRGISFFAVNSNPDQYIWTSSPKVYANIYIDDAAFGCPLIENIFGNERPMVDWSKVGPNIHSMLSSDI